MLPNVLQYPVAIVGALRAGLTIVNTNPLYTPRELEHQLRDSGARAILILENFAHTLDAVIAATDVDTVIVTGVGDMLAFPKSVIANFVLRHVRKQVPDYSLPGAIRFADALSKGTLREPRPGGARARGHRVPAVHRRHDRRFQGRRAHPSQPGRERPAARGVVRPRPRREPRTARSSARCRSITSSRSTALFFLRLGGRNLLIANPRDFPGFVRSSRSRRFTFFSGVNTLFNALLHTPGFDRLDFSHLRVTLGGGMAVQRAVADRWKKVTGNTLTQAWGLTETSPGAGQPARR